MTIACLSRDVAALIAPAWEAEGPDLVDGRQKSFVRRSMPFAKESVPVTKAIPEGFHTVTPAFMVKDSHKAIAFYERHSGPPSTA